MRKASDDLDTIFDKFKVQPTLFMDTKSKLLNYAFSGDPNGGLPLGRIIEIYGAESAGKSTFSYYLLSLAQKNGFTCLLADTEGAFDTRQANRCGIDIDKQFYRIPPSPVKEVFETIANFVIKFYTKNPNGKLIVVYDSIAASSLFSTLDKFSNEPQAELARIISLMLNKINYPISRYNVVFVALNQIRLASKGATIFVEESPGGKALKFYATIRGRLKREKNEDKGIVSSLNITKNKIAPHGAQVFLGITFDHGIDLGWTVWETTQKSGLQIFNRAGAYWDYKGVKKHAQDWIQILNDDDALREEIEKQLISHINKMRDISEEGDEDASNY